MRVAAVIAEYDPFHRGHAYLVQAARKAGATHVAAILSGQFLQRGAAACFSKWTRARQALSCGVDLVVELPLPWAMAGAQTFARGGVALAAALGADVLAFGSECGDATALEAVAEALLQKPLNTAVRTYLQGGIPYAKAREQAVADALGKKVAALLRTPNNILGIAYCEAIRLLDVPLKTLTVRRIGASHDSTAPDALPSATRIRAQLCTNGNWQAGLPRPSAAVAVKALAAGMAPALLSRVERAVLYRLRTMTREELAALPDVREGLENRLYAAARKADSLETLYASVKTKRYSHARIRRVTLSAFLGLRAGMAEATPPYLRVLGFADAGREILARAKQKAILPLVTRASDRFRLDSRGQSVFELENTATDIWALCLPTPAPAGLDLTTGVLALSHRGGESIGN